MIENVVTDTAHEELRDSYDNERFAVTQRTIVGGAKTIIINPREAQALIADLKRFVGKAQNEG